MVYRFERWRKERKEHLLHGLFIIVTGRLPAEKKSQPSSNRKAHGKDIFSSICVTVFLLPFFIEVTHWKRTNPFLLAATVTEN